MTRFTAKNQTRSFYALVISLFVGITLLSFNVDAAEVKSARKEAKQSLDPGSNDVLAKTADGVEVTVADILSEVNKMQPDARPEFFKRPENIHQIVNNLLVRRLLANQSKKDKLDEDQVVKAALSVARDRVMSDARLNKMDQENEPTQEAMQSYALAFYKANLEKYQTPAQTRASHILIEKTDDSAVKKAEEIILKIKNGEKFEDLAKEHSKDPGSAQRGGDLGYFASGRMVKPFEEALNKMTVPGEISPPIESQFGLHIIRLEDRKPVATKSYEEVKEKILLEARGGILTEKRMLAVQKLISQIQFQKDAIVKLSKEASESLSSK